jgi:hypothetical protein
MTRERLKASFRIVIAAVLSGAGVLAGPLAARAQDAPTSTAADAADGGAPMAGPFGAPPPRLDNGPGMGPGFPREPGPRMSPRLDAGRDNAELILSWVVAEIGALFQKIQRSPCVN